MSDYQSISIIDAMDNISNNLYLLPAIQRKFVWDRGQIEDLFDSILRGYPINSFMFWYVTDKKNKHDYEFYTFIRDFVERFKEENGDASTKLKKKDFYAVIDGQQRLTSLYIGLDGSYKIKRPRKAWKENEQQTEMIKTELYLELKNPLNLQVDNEKKYNFKFLSSEDLEKEKKGKVAHFWFKVGELANFESLSDVNSYLIKHNLLSNKFATDTLTTLYSRFCTEKLISYYCVNTQEQDEVLNIFVRANSGGTPLSFSDLLMSISSANWKQYTAKEELEETKAAINSKGNPNFYVSQDFILKAILVLSDGDVRFRISNFSKERVKGFEDKWLDIKKSLINTFELLQQLNFNETVLRSKNAVIPIAYYIYKRGLAEAIVKTKYDDKDKKIISRWLCMSLLKGIFGGTSDSVLDTIRKVIRDSKSDRFPMNEIIDKFRGTNRDYSFDKETVYSLLNEQHGSTKCGIVLNLLYPNVALEHGKAVQQDHMHPKNIFESKKEFAKLKLKPEQIEFYQNNYNTCLNLQLLEESENKSKGTQDLKTWAKKKNKTYMDLHIKKDTSLKIKDFEQFINDRRTVLGKELKRILIDDINN